ncbi:MAG: indole-3-glycerol phosphate synthase TrpC [Dehalococcoidia bacterium]|jgi:indole-3-glycerol phosphate synthase|nr:indole-3-glycerol phosphate synthase TrpC [Dehalococcoidia bacterium]
MNWNKFELGEVLIDILNSKKDLIDFKKQKLPLKNLIKNISEEINFDFSKAISEKPNIQIIAELKRSSASAGNLQSNLSIEEMAKIYLNNDCAAISVLTEKTKFSGDIKDLRSIVNLSKKFETPILQKDFIFDEYQVYEGKANGASAILLILSILEPSQFKKLFKLIESLNMTPLVEIFSEHELDLALSQGAKVIGINNRDLKKLETSLKVFENLAPLVPKDLTLIAESGIKTVEDVKLMADLGADAILIGETLLKAGDKSDQIIKEMSSIRKNEN